MPIEEGRQLVGNEGAGEPATPRGGAIPIVTVMIRLIRMDGGLCSFTFTIADNIESNARHGEGSQQPKRIHITQDVDLAAHEKKYNDANVRGQSDQSVRRTAEPVALQDKIGE